MTTLLKKAITRINRLDDNEQDAIAEMLNQELNWNKSFNNSQNQLASLAQEALVEYSTGKTKPMKLK